MLEVCTAILTIVTVLVYIEVTDIKKLLEQLVRNSTQEIKSPNNE